MKTVQFEDAAYSDFVNWGTINKAIFKKIADLVKDIDRNGVNTGIGKPEPLKHNLTGYWSRWITNEHRLVYKIENEIIVIPQCKGHYK